MSFIFTSISSCVYIGASQDSVLAFFPIFASSCSFELSSSPVTLNVFYIWRTWSLFPWLLTSSLNSRFINLAASVTFLYGWFPKDLFFLYSPHYQLVTVPPPNLVEIVDSSLLSLTLYPSINKWCQILIPSELICSSPYFHCLVSSKLSFLWVSCYFSKCAPYFVFLETGIL